MTNNESPTTAVSNDSLNTRPLVIDLDGTLVATDTLWESLLLLARDRPADLLKLPVWAAAGRAAFKQKLAQRVRLDPAALPYRQPVLSFLRQQKQQGRQLILATGADQRTAKRVAQHLQLFDDVIASDGITNYTGKRKLAAIRDAVGRREFDYVGDSYQDVPLWRQAHEAILVEPNALVLRRVRAEGKPTKVFGDPSGRALDLLRACRLSHWAKNLLLAVPLVVGHEYGDPAKLVALLVAFVAFGLCASSVYVFNDLLDLPADRQHPSKRNRPFAAGRLPIRTGLITAGLLIAAGFVLAACVRPSPWAFVGMLGLYLVLTTAYSLYLKRKPVVDVLVLAGLYTHRILTGGVVVSIIPTPWLLAFSVFVFVSLAFAKRYTELLSLRERLGADRAEAAQADQARRTGTGRGYLAEDIGAVASFGATSGYLAVLVFCLYITSLDETGLYQRPELLWFICPILLYWISRIWLLARRGQLHDDPVIFALTDRVSYVAGALILFIIMAAAWWR